jgi:hypothetical protein
MDWPQDPDGDEGSEGKRKYGMAILAKKLDDESDFPLDVDEFVEEYGDDPIRLNHRSVVSVAEIFEHVDEDGFEDIVSFHKGVGRAMRSGGFWEYHPTGDDPAKKSA